MSLPAETTAVKHDLLWESLRSGNVKAFERVFHLYYHVLFRYGIKFSHTEEEVKDCIQSLFLQIWERRLFLGPTTSVKSYLMASLRRLLHQRAHKDESTISLENHDFQTELSVESKLIATQAEAEMIGLVRTAFEKLPARQKEAIYLRFYDNQNFDEIADIMGISVRATYKLIYKGLDNLQKQLGSRPIDLGHLLPVLFIAANLL